MKQKHVGLVHEISMHTVLPQHSTYELPGAEWKCEHEGNHLYAWLTACVMARCTNVQNMGSFFDRLDVRCFFLKVMLRLNFLGQNL